MTIMRSSERWGVGATCSYHRDGALLGFQWRSPAWPLRGSCRNALLYIANLNLNLIHTSAPARSSDLSRESSVIF
jgi:hypothetical protein